MFGFEKCLHKELLELFVLQLFKIFDLLITVIPFDFLERVGAEFYQLIDKVFSLVSMTSMAFFFGRYYSLAIVVKNFLCQFEFINEFKNIFLEFDWRVLGRSHCKNDTMNPISI